MLTKTHIHALFMRSLQVCLLEQRLDVLQPPLDLLYLALHLHHL